jgi:Spy/CpxP family protein refolding chaperone
MIEMKKQLCTIALSGLLAAGMSVAAASAQDNSMQQQGGTMQGPPPQGSMQGGHGRWGNPDEMLAHMTKRYNLTADQQTQLKPILTDQQQQMMQMRSDTTMSKQDKMAKMKSMHDESTQKIEAILTPDQKAKFESDQAAMAAKRAERMQNGGGSDSAPPPAPPQ